MSYLWQEFNIKTFPAETIVYRDGVFCPELSTIQSGKIDKNYDLPVHIIFVGEITGKCRLDIDILVENQPVVISAKIKNKKPAFFDIFVKNAGKNSELRGTVLIENSSDITFNITANHAADNTTIVVKNKLVADAGSNSKMHGAAIIPKNINGCVSDIGFAALMDEDAVLEFSPSQYISAIPASAEHSSAIYAPTPPQILYLRQAGLNGAETVATMRQAFIDG